jgi:hypothetical protein
MSAAPVNTERDWRWTFAVSRDSGHAGYVHCRAPDIRAAFARVRAARPDLAKAQLIWTGIKASAP